MNHHHRNGKSPKELLCDMLHELEDLEERKKEAAAAFTNAIKLAGQTGFDP